MMKAPETTPIEMIPRNIRLEYKLRNWTLTIKDKKRTVKVLLSPKLIILLKALVNDQ